jgi:hypothetical protein
METKLLQRCRPGVGKNVLARRDMAKFGTFFVRKRQIGVHRLISSVGSIQYVG